MIYLSIIIPAYNEERKIVSTLARVLKYLSTKHYLWEIILVDDDSIDRTSEAARGMIKDERLTVIKNPVNQGKGYSVKKGVLASKGDIILFSDADLSTPIEELDKMLLWFNEGYDIVIGSRALPESSIEIRQLWYREIMGKTFNLLVRTFVLSGFGDTQCGFKCFKREAALKVFNLQKINGFAFDVEILLIAERLRLKVKEVPIVWINSPESKVHLIRGSFSMLWELFKIKFYEWKHVTWMI